MSIEVYPLGDFSFIQDESSRRYVKDAYDATVVSEQMELMKEEPEADKGYMFSSDERYELIHKHMKFLGEHSGSSYAWTMRQVQYIAQKGWTAYVNLHQTS
jgi:uncharacterized Fe-S radical SAM superfamily protein PflX